MAVGGAPGTNAKVPGIQGPHSCIVGLIACLLQVAPVAPPPLQAFRVMTWNIAAGHGDLSKTADVIREARPDIVALQEVDAHWEKRSDFADQPAEEPSNGISWSPEQLDEFAANCSIDFSELWYSTD